MGEYLFLEKCASDLTKHIYNLNNVVKFVCITQVLQHMQNQDD